MKPSSEKVTIDEKLIFELNPVDVTVNEELPRHRKELGKIQEMVESIKLFGQIQPIVINRNDELVVGGRRLAACLLGGFKVRACYKDTVDTLLMRELELEENVQRKNFTPAEEVTAVAELVAIKQKRLGKPTQGQVGGFTLEDAASTLGKSKGAVILDLQLADAIKMFPNLADCKTKSDIKKAVKGLERTHQNIKALASYEETIKKTKEFILVNNDALEHMRGVGDATVDVLFTDPPYGINIDKVAMSIGGHTGGDITTTGIKYDDSPEQALLLYQALATESARFCKDTAHALVFVGPSHFWVIKEMFNQAGWICSERPVIWVKGGSGQNNNPDAWFSSAYEMLLFARKPKAKLVLWGKPDWIQCSIVSSEHRLHQAEKPVLLCKELIARTCMPGQYLYDPFMGSGAILEAAYEMKLLSIGCEIAVESYASAVSRMTKLKGIENK